MRRRVLLALAHGTWLAVLAGTFTGALLAGVTLHGSLPAVRRVAAAIGNQVLGDLFEGKVVVRDIRSLHIGTTSGLRAREVEVFDPDGKRVVLANDIEASIDLRTVIHSVVSGGAPNVDITDVKIGRADVTLDVDAAGTPLIARTFKPRKQPTTPGAPPSPLPLPLPTTPSPDPIVHIRKAWIGHAHVHGNLVPPALDGDGDDLHAQLTVEHNVVAMSLDSGRITLRSPKAPNQRLPIVGDAKGALSVDIATTQLTGHADLTGACGEIPVIAHAQIDKDQVEASVDIARTTPAAIAAAFTDVPVTEPVEIHARARGKLPSITIEARANIGASALVTATGEIDLREGHAFKLDAEATDIDARAFGADVATDLSAKLHGEGVLGNAPLGSFRLTTSEGSVSTERIPAALVEGRFEGQQVTATVRAKEPGVEANGKLVLDVPSRIVTFDLQARSDSLRSLSRAPNVVGGAASARARGKLDLTTKTIHASTTATGDGIAIDVLSARHISANGTLAGPIAAPILDVAFTGEDVQVKAKAKTPLTYATASGHAKVAFVPSPRVLDASITVGQSGAAVTASAEAVHVSGGVIEARGLRVTGLGEPLELDARLGRGEWKLRAKSAGIDLHRAAALTGIAELKILPEGTRAALDVDVRQGSAGADGHFDIVVRSEKGLLGPGALVAEAHGTLDRGKLVATAKVASEGFGQVEVTRAELELPRQMDARSLQRTTGIVELRGSIDLSQGAALFAGENVERVAGIASFGARIERGDPDALPAVRGTVRTEGLEVALSGDPTSRTVLISGINLVTHVAWDGRTEDAEVALVSWDSHGVLGSASAKAKIPILAWATGKQKLDADALARLDVQGVAEVPSRDVRELPSFLGISGVRGEVAGHFQIAGTLARPTVVLSGRAKKLHEDRSGAPGTAFDPLDGVFEARWDGERGAITFSLDERPRPPRQRPQQKPGAPARAGLAAARRQKKDPGHLRGLVLLTDARIVDLLKGTPLSKLPWLASAEIEVEDLALAALPFPTPIAGALTGRVRITDLNREPSFEGKLHVDDFGTGGAKVAQLDVTVGGRDASLFAHAAIVDAKTQATFQLASKALRMKGVDVSWDASALTRVDYVVQNGRLALLAPLVKGVISEIDGRVDGAGSVSIDASSQVFEGGLAFQDARLYVNVLGEEITSLDAIARFERTGTFRIDDAAGKVGAGEFRASASGRMKGLLFMGANATLIASKEGIPISAEGATFAEATGEVKVSAKMSDDRSALIVNVDVPRADVQLPDRTTQSLQRLEPDPTVAIGVRKRNGELDTKAIRKGRGGTGKQAALVTSAEAGALVTRMTVTLGKDVRLEGRGLDINLGGRTLIELAEEVKVTGRIDLRGGTIEVHGRRFNVDRGTVTFPDGGVPANPTVVAAAYWDAPDRTRVWVEFAGPLKSGNLTLRSEPPYSKTEILSVLLFGRPDPNQATGGGKSDKTGDASGATAIGTGFLAGDINNVLSEIDENLDIETDTLSGNRTRTKLGRSFFDRRLKVQLGVAPGYTYREPDTAYLFLNWQFIPKWSLLVTRGNRGTSILDVLFQHRY